MGFVAPTKIPPTNPCCPVLFYSQLISGIWGFLAPAGRGKNGRLGGGSWLNVVTLSLHKKDDSDACDNDSYDADDENRLQEVLI